MKTAFVVGTAAAGLAVLATSSCSSTAPTAVASSSPPPVASPVSTPGVPACDAATLTEPVKAAIGPTQALRRLSGAECDGGWAVVAPTIGPPDGSSDGEIDITLVFRAVNGAWVDQDRAAVCGTLPTSDGSPAYPPDAQVPSSIWRGACQTN